MASAHVEMKLGRGRPRPGVRGAAGPRGSPDSIVMSSPRDGRSTEWFDREWVSGFRGFLGSGEGPSSPHRDGREDTVASSFSDVQSPKT
jgi:hypothetical protein